MIEIETRCEFQDLKQPWTVGDHQKLVCHWERSTEFTQPFVIKFAREEDNYTLALLETMATDKKLEAIVTGYKPGKHQNVSFSILSGDKNLTVAPLSWDIQATVKQEQQAGQQQQPPQPVPSYGPFALPFPAWITWTALVLLIAAIGIAIYSYYQRRRKKIFKAKLDEYLHKGAPHQQVHAALRALIRSLDSGQKSSVEVLNEMDLLLKQYLMGTFALPTEGLGAQKLIDTLGSRFEKWSKDLKIQFRQFTFDLERLKIEATSLNQEDLLDLGFRLRRLIDLIQFQRGRS